MIVENNSNRKIVGTYPYRDESGKLLYEVVRYDPKDFRQRIPNGAKWTYSLNGTRRVLYRLPEILATDSIVWIVEGEKDADRLASMGLTATTAAMGAGKWRSEYSESLRGRHVIIIPDNDDPGHKHAKAVKKALDGIAASVTILTLPGLPPKGDVSDWLDAGNDKAKLLEVAQAAVAVEQARQAEQQTDETAQSTDDAEKINLTDKGNGQRLVRQFGRDLRHCYPWRKWLSWDGKRWRVDDTGAVVRFAKKTLVILFKWAMAKMQEVQKALEDANE